MPISGLVLNLADATRVPDVAATLRRDPRITLGVPCDRKLPLVADTPGKAEDRDLHARLQDLPGVLSIDLVFIHFDPPEIRGSAPPASCPSEDRDP